MIKIFPAEKIREADAFTIINEPIASVDLMERAATLCYNWIVRKKPIGKKIKLFCGTGNNGGDGLVIARLLTKAGYHCEVFLVKFSEKYSDDFHNNLQRLREAAPTLIQDVLSGDELPAIATDDLVIDAMFGTGLSKPVISFPENMIRHINNSGAVVIAIDIPSGMFADQLPESRNGEIIQADYTLTFQFPKLSFFFAESEQYTGAWEVLPIGLHPDFIQAAHTSHFMTDAGDIATFLKPRKRFSHKGIFGHSLLVAGSYGKMGAAILAARSCMRSGAGLLTVHIPGKGYNILQTAFPEAMVSIDEEQDFFSGVKDILPYNAIAIGPGIGTADKTKSGLKLLIQHCRSPLILDADALNILAENKTWLSFLPPGSILTPHPKEFERIASKSTNSLERLELQKQFSAKYNVFVILKGAFTSITSPDGRCYFNPTGNPGMASGGSGDVLTGILLGLLAQGYSPFTTCLAGTYLHGLAGDLAAVKRGYESLIASDIIDNLGKAFKMV